MNRLPVVDLAVLAAYLLAMVAMGVWFGRKSKTTRDFTTAGGAVPGWAVGLSIFGTYVSSISFLALPGKAFGSNWNGFVFSLAIPFTTWIAVKWFVPFYRRSGEVSAYGHLEKRFGLWARTYAVLCYLATQVARIGIIMYLLGVALAPMTGSSVPVLIVITGFIVIAYTIYGGMEAVIWTDVVQSIVFIVGSLVCVGVLLYGMPGGVSQSFRIAVEHDKFDLGSYAADLSRATFWVVLLNGIAINLQNFGIDQSYVQRYATARSDREANRSVWLGALLYVPISAVFFSIGTLLYAYYTARPADLPASLHAAGSADKVFPYFIAHGLPIGLGGLVVAAVFSAAQSTISSSINCSATLILCDFYKRYFRPDAGERQSMLVLRIATLVIGVIGTAAGLAMLGIKSALDAWWSLASIFSGGMLGLFLLGMLARRARGRDALIGVIAGILSIVWMTASLKLTWPSQLAGFRSPFHDFLIVVVGTAVILGVGIFCSLLHPAAAAARVRLSAESQK